MTSWKAEVINVIKDKVGNIAKLKEGAVQSIKAAKETN